MNISLFKPGTVLTGGKKIYQKFTPFITHVYQFKVEEPNLDMKLHNGMIEMQIVNIQLICGRGIFIINIIYNINIDGGRKIQTKFAKNFDKFKKYDDTRNTLSIQTTKSGYIKFNFINFYH